jgi:hypothetical protein
MEYASRADDDGEPDRLKPASCSAAPPAASSVPPPGRFSATVRLAMAKRPTKQHSWAVYHIRGTPAQFVGIVYDQPDDRAALANK